MDNQDKYIITKLDSDLFSYKIPSENIDILLEKEFYIKEQFLDSLCWFEVNLKYDYQELTDKKSLNEKYNELEELIKSGYIIHFYKELDHTWNIIKIFKKSKFIKQKQGYIRIIYPNYNEGIKPIVEYLEGYLKVLNKLFLILNLKEYIWLYKYNYRKIIVNNNIVEYIISVTLYKENYKIVLNEEFYQKNKLLEAVALYILLIIKKNKKNIELNKKKYEHRFISFEFNKKEHGIKEIIGKLKATFIELENNKDILVYVCIKKYIYEKQS